MFPMNIRIYRRTKETQPKRTHTILCLPYLSAEKKKGERERCVKGLPERDAQEFLKNILFQVFKIAARL